MEKKFCHELMITPFLTVNNFIFYLRYDCIQVLFERFILFLNKKDLKM